MKVLSRKHKTRKNKVIICFAFFTLIFCSISGLLATSNSHQQGTALLKKDIAHIQLIKAMPDIHLQPEANEEIGYFIFPKVDLKVPLVYGYNSDYMDQYFDELGLEAWNNFPGQNNKIYINGHRHLAFQNLKYIEVGDIIILEMKYGKFTYKVTQEPQIVLANNQEAVDFYFNERNKAFSPQILRLQTCYPFEAGSTLNHRYLVDLVLVSSEYYV